MSLGNVFFWGISFALNNFFPGLLDGLGKQGTFLLFSVMSAAVALCLQAVLVETAGRSLRDIEDLVVVGAR